MTKGHEDDAADRAAAIKRRNADRLEDDGMMTWMLFAAAALSAGTKDARNSAKIADDMMAETKKRFT